MAKTVLIVEDNDLNMKLFHDLLEAHGRSGVPLYLWYPGDGGKPDELPQILTPSLLISLARGGK